MGDNQPMSAREGLLPGASSRPVAGGNLAAFAPGERGSLRVLLTGCGARGLAVGAVQSLRRSRSFDVSVVGVDAAPTAVGRYAVDRFHLVPRADDPAYLRTIEALIRSEQVDVVIPLLDAELPVLATLDRSGHAVLASPSPLVLELCGDKSRLLSELYEQGLNPDLLT